MAVISLPVMRMLPSNVYIICFKKQEICPILLQYKFFMHSRSKKTIISLSANLLIFVAEK
jgi:hypothetical protein